ncbi:MAG: ATP-binding cassette domain-containing protein [Rhodobacteraceae bacterium]|nr:MAG: ATP-binding cassette domain-containing protein [Paracoccaceae bacterium]
MRRAAEAAGLLVRPATLADAALGATPGPVAAFAGDEVALVWGGRGWFGPAPRIADARSGWRLRRRRARALARFDPHALMLTPALPDAPLTAGRLLRFGLRPARADLARFALATLAGGLTGAAPAFVGGPLVDVVIPSADGDLLAAVALFLLAAFLAALGARLIAALARLRLDGRIGAMLRFAAVDRALRLAGAAAQSGRAPPPGPVAAMATRMMQGFHAGVWGLGLSLGAAVLLAAPSLAVLATASAAGGLAALVVFLGGLGLAAWLAGRRAAALTAGGPSAQSWMTTAYEALSRLDTVRAGAAEERFFARWAEGFLGLRRRFLAADRVGAAAQAAESAFEPLLVAAAVLALAMGGALGLAMGDGAPDGPSTAAVVLAAGTAAGAATEAMRALGEAPSLGLQRRMIAPLLDGPPPRRRGAPPAAPTGRIAARAVSARHAPGLPLAVRDVTFDLAPGGRLGLAGPSGSGKTTLLRALLGLIPLAGGAVLHDGRDLAGLDASALRRRIGVVGQGGRLFPGTLGENVAAGLDLPPRAIMAALAQAGLEDALARLPLGLATPIGDATSVFSGGEAQRVLLARAFAVRPKLLVLDEATSALDQALQAQVSAAVDALDCAAIIVAHRLETLRGCDEILVMESGRIVERGGHDALARGGGLFARMIAAAGAGPAGDARNPAV